MCYNRNKGGVIMNILTKDYLKELYRRYKEVQKGHINNELYDYRNYLKENVWCIADGQFIYNSSLDSRFEPDYYFRGIDENGYNIYRFSEYNENLIPCEMTSNACRLLTSSIQALEEVINNMEEYNDSTNIFEYRKNA